MVEVVKCSKMSLAENKSNRKSSKFNLELKKVSEPRKGWRKWIFLSSKPSNKKKVVKFSEKEITEIVEEEKSLEIIPPQPPPPNKTNNYNNYYDRPPPVFNNNRGIIWRPRLPQHLRNQPANFGLRSRCLHHLYPIYQPPGLLFRPVGAQGPTGSWPRAPPLRPPFVTQNVPNSYPRGHHKLPRVSVSVAPSPQVINASRRNNLNRSEGIVRGKRKLLLARCVR